MKLRCVVAVVSVLCLAVPAAMSQQAGQEQVIELTVTPARIPSPALKYVPIPSVADQTPGNAASLYYQAVQRLQGSADEQWVTAQQLLETPIDELDVHELEQFISGYMHLLQLVDIAARRGQIRWDLPIREQGVGTLLPHLHGQRQLIQLMALRGRLELKQRRFDDAARTLQTCVMMSKHAGDQGLLVQALISTGMVNQALELVHDWARTFDAPSLYWFLAHMPQPFTNPAEVMRLERDLVRFSIPSLAADLESMTAEQWRQALDETFDVARQFGVAEQYVRQQAARRAAIGVVLYPAAKRYLISQGRDPVVVDAMAVPQVVGIYIHGRFQQYYDDMIKWCALPYWQGREGMRRATVSVVDARDEFGLNPLLGVVPRVAPALQTLVRLDRKIAMMQIIEGLRAYAADHDNTFPESLDQMTNTPAPLDPATNQPFEYSLNNGFATLVAPAVHELPAMRYVVRLAE